MSTATTDPEELVDFDDAVLVAPNWKLVWWRFKKHRLAFYSGFIVILIVIIAAFPGFFSTQDPYESATRGSFSRIDFLPL